SESGDVRTDHAHVLAFPRRFGRRADSVRAARAAFRFGARYGNPRTQRPDRGDAPANLRSGAQGLTFRPSRLPPPRLCFGARRKSAEEKPCWSGFVIFIFRFV